jgi:hypothetical protein
MEINGTKKQGDTEPSTQLELQLQRTRRSRFASGCNLESNRALPAHPVPSVLFTCAFRLVVRPRVHFRGLRDPGADHRQRTSLPPAAFTEQEAAPENLSARGSWWEVVNDPILAWLETQAKTANLNLEAAGARLKRAPAISSMTGVEQYPEADLLDALAPRHFSDSRGPT